MNLLHSLVTIGVDHGLAEQWVEKTHGIYAALKAKIFNIPASPQRPAWVENPSEEILAALLIGSWSENEGDKDVFQAFSGKTYDECIKELKKYERIEEPLIITTENYHGRLCQIACIEEAWIALFPYIDEDLLSKFFDTAVSVMNHPDLVFQDLAEQYVAMKNGSDIPHWSKALKRGLLRTLILLTCLDDNRKHWYKVNHTVKQILNTLSGKNDWLYMSNYMDSLCEAAPETVLEKFESELDPQSGTGMLEAFDGSEYYHIFWAVEQLIQQKEYLSRAIQWLWIMNDKRIRYQAGNSPKSILEIVFCAWFNMTPMTSDQKIFEAKTAMEKYHTAWDLICSRLPRNNDTVFSTLCKPRFRNTFEPKSAFVEDANKVFIEYLNLCINSANLDTARWCTILDELTHFEKPIQEEKMDQLTSLVEQMTDSGKTEIKEKLREIVYRHRRFGNSDWAMDNERINLFEIAYNSIFVEDKTFDYLYLFSPSHSFPLLYPVLYTPNDKTHTNRDQEEEHIDEERRTAVKRFRNNNLSVAHLIELAAERKKENNLGFVLAHYFDQDSFNETTFESLVKYASSFPFEIYQYVRNVLLNGQTDFPEIYDKLKTLTTDASLIARILSLQIVSSIDDCLVFQEAEIIKKTFWSEGNTIVFSGNPNSEIIKKALDECLSFGNLSTYVEFLFNIKDCLTPDDLYLYFLKAENARVDESSFSTMTGWYIEQILKIMHENFLDDSERAFHIARMEWFFGNLLQWDQMKCMQKHMKTDPHVYAYLVDIMYKKDHTEKLDPEKQKCAGRMYGLFREIHFCPAEKKGQVDYDDLKQWVDQFKKILKEQDQLSLWDTVLGNLFPYSPVDEDGYMPCKAVRQIIEEYHTDNMQSAYITTEFNKRGVYSPNAGRSEKAIAQRYKQNADMIRIPYRHTARIYDDLSRHYLEMADDERKRAEDDM